MWYKYIHRGKEGCGDSAFFYKGLPKKGEIVLKERAFQDPFVEKRWPTDTKIICQSCRGLVCGLNLENLEPVSNQKIYRS